MSTPLLCLIPCATAYFDLLVSAHARARALSPPPPVRAEALAVGNMITRTSCSPGLPVSCTQTLGRSLTQEAITAVVQELVAVKQAHRRKTWKPRGKGKGKGRDVPAATKPAWDVYPDAVQLPMSVEDPEFVQSFRHDDPLASEFFDRFGFVVFEAVISAAECAATRQEVWSQLGSTHPGFKHDDASTWDRTKPLPPNISDITSHVFFLSEAVSLPMCVLPYKHRTIFGMLFKLVKLREIMGAGLSSKTYGLPPQQAIFTPQLLGNRQNPAVVGALRHALRCEDVLVSHDRWCVYRPTRGHPEWKTRGNLHLDVQPWSYVGGETQVEDLEYSELVDFITETNSVIRDSGPHVQGVLNLLDNRDVDGGTHLVPCFHKHFDAWLDKLGGVEANTSEGGHHNWVVRRRQGGGSFKFCPSDPIHTRARRIPMREGSLLIWNQEVVHGSVPNNSGTWRMAQFIKAFPSTPLTPGRALKRARAVHSLINKAGLLDRVSPLGHSVFGLGNLPSA